MPYATNDDLPVSVQRHLPPHAQDIYREAFNHAYASHADEEARASHRLGGGEAIVRQGWRQLGRPFACLRCQRVLMSWLK